MKLVPPKDLGRINEHSFMYLISFSLNFQPSLIWRLSKIVCVLRISMTCSIWDNQCTCNPFVVVHNSILSSVLWYNNEWGEPTARCKWAGLSLRNSQLKFKSLGKFTDCFRGICRIFLELIMKTDLESGLGNARILTDYAERPPQTLWYTMNGENQLLITDQPVVFEK